MKDIWRHEGDQSRPPNSHVDTALREWTRLIKAESEGIVANDIDATIGQKFDEWNKQSGVYSRSVTDNSANPLQGTAVSRCVFNFNY